MHTVCVLAVHFRLNIRNLECFAISVRLSKGMTRIVCTGCDMVTKCRDLHIARSSLHSIDSLYSTNSVNVYVPSDNQQFRYKIARGW